MKFHSNERTPCYTPCNTFVTPLLHICNTRFTHLLHPLLHLRYTVLTLSLIITFLMHPYSYSVTFCPVFVCDILSVSDLWHFFLWHFVRDSRNLYHVIFFCWTLVCTWIEKTIDPIYTIPFVGDRFEFEIFRKILKVNFF